MYDAPLVINAGSGPSDTTYSDELPTLPDPNDATLPEWFRPYAKVVSSLTASESEADKLQSRQIDAEEQAIYNYQSSELVPPSIPNDSGSESE